MTFLAVQDDVIAVQSRSDREPTVAGVGHHVDLAEGGLTKDLRVRQTVQRDATSEREARLPRARMDPARDVHHDLLRQCLTAPSEVIVILGEGRSPLSAWAEIPHLVEVLEPVLIRSNGEVETAVVEELEHVLADPPVKPARAERGER